MTDINACRERPKDMERRHSQHRFDSPADREFEKHSALTGQSIERVSDRHVSPDADPLPEPNAAETVVMIPIFNDWASLARLLPKLDSVLASHYRTVDVLVVDDGSTVEPAAQTENGPFAALRRVDVLRLRRKPGPSASDRRWSGLYRRPPVNGRCGRHGRRRRG